MICGGGEMSKTDDGNRNINFLYFSQAPGWSDISSDLPTKLNQLCMVSSWVNQIWSSRESITMNIHHELQRGISTVRNKPA